MIKLFAWCLFFCLLVCLSFSELRPEFPWMKLLASSIFEYMLYFFFLLILLMWWFSANSEEQVGLWVWIYLLWSLAYYGGSFFGSWGFTVWELEWVNFADYQVWCDVLACIFQRLYPNVKAARSESTCPTAEFFFALEKKKTENILDATKNFYSFQVDINTNSWIYHFSSTA